MEILEGYPTLREFVLTNVEVIDMKKRLGSGSYGAVQEMIINGTAYAVKVMHESLPKDADTVARIFLHECQIMARIQHPNIVQFIGLYLTKERRLPLLVMEKLDSNLRSLLKSKPDLPLSVSQYIVVCVCRGLQYLHSQCVVHGDLTARNILLSETLTAKIIDFGTSRIVYPGQDDCFLPRPVGTSAYMPPEVWSKSLCGPSLDVFSFGVLLLFTLTEVYPSDLHPSTYPDPANSSNSIVRSEVERRSEYTVLLKMRLPGEHDHPLFRLVEACLANNAESRPMTSELLSTLEGAAVYDESDVSLQLAAVKVALDKKDAELAAASKPGKMTCTTAERDAQIDQLSLN